jgi:hypothetical protein
MWRTIKAQFCFVFFWSLYVVAIWIQPDREPYVTGMTHMKEGYDIEPISQERNRQWHHTTEEITFLANQYSDKVQIQVTPIFIVDLCTCMTDEEG